MSPTDSIASQTSPLSFSLARKLLVLLAAFATVLACAGVGANVQQAQALERWTFTSPVSFDYLPVSDSVPSKNDINLGRGSISQLTVQSVAWKGKAPGATSFGNATKIQEGYSYKCELTISSTATTFPSGDTSIFVNGVEWTVGSPINIGGSTGTMVTITSPECTGVNPEQKCGDDAYWMWFEKYDVYKPANLYLENALVVTGAGEMKGYSGGGSSESSAPWAAYKDQLQAVVIAGDIVSVGNGAFFSGYGANTFPNLKEVYLTSKKLQKIGYRAFYNCTELLSGPQSLSPIFDSMDIPDTVTEIGEGAFVKCAKIENITIPSGLTSLGNDAFSHCEALKGPITIPDGIAKCPSELFSSCKSLTGVTLPDGWTTLGSELFWGCESLTSFAIGPNVEKIRLRCFCGCTNLATISNFSSNTKIKDIEYQAFKDCTALTGTFTVPTNVANIGFEAFSGCKNVTKFVLPSKNSDGTPKVTLGDTDWGANCGVFAGCSGVTSFDNFGLVEAGIKKIPAQLFRACTGLTNVTLPSSIEEIGLNAFERCNGLVDFTVQDGTTVIKSGAFNDCANLQTITIPASITALGKDNYGRLSEVFKNCEKLTIRGYANSLAHLHALEYDIPFTSIGSVAPFGGSCGDSATWTFDAATGTLTISGSGEMSDKYSWTGSDMAPWMGFGYAVKHVAIESGVTSVGKYAFYELKKLESISLPTSLEYIGAGAFTRCSKLESVVVPEGVTRIDNYAFDHCAALSSVSLPNTLTTLGEEVFVNCTALVSIVIPDSVTTIRASSNSGTDTGLFNGCTSLKDVTYSAGMKSIPRGTFEHTALESFTVPANVTSIGAQAFMDCTKLAKVTIPKGVTEIGWSAFRDCTALTSIAMPDSVTVLGSNAFNGCTALANAKLSSGLTEIPSGAFSSCTALTSIEIPAKVTVIDNYAFEKSGLKRIVIPANVTEIGVEAFYDCSSLKEVRIEGKDVKIGERAFACYDSVLGDYITLPNLKIYAPAGSKTAAALKALGVSFIESGSVSAAKITVKDMVYTGKALKPAVTVKVGNKTLKAGTDYTIAYKNNKSVGMATVTIAGKDAYKGSCSKTFKIVPKGTKVKKLTKAKKAITVKWKKQTKQTSGYQIMLATNKKFTKGKKSVTVKGAKKTSKKVKKLKSKKKYWVKVRTYKTVSGKKYYSSWSKAKTVKTK